MLAVRQLSKSFGARALFRGVDLDVAPGEYIAIMGESGTGKSTLLNLLAGLETPDSGSIALEGRDTTTLNDDERTHLRRRRLGFVFQAFHVLPYLDVADNIALPLALNGVAPGERTKRVASMLEAVGLAGRSCSRPRELSGGELQRVAIARALVHGPALLLADEPTGNLDAQTAGQILCLLRERIAACRMAAILVTHSPAAAATTDRVYVLGAEGLRLDAQPR
jgi:putative ABC transport system ATP-binding protein